jgi:hypothetical protein
MDDRKHAEAAPDGVPRHGRELVANADAKRAEVAARLAETPELRVVIECRIGDAGYILRITDRNTFLHADYPTVWPTAEIARDFVNRHRPS